MHIQDKGVGMVKIALALLMMIVAGMALTIALAPPIQPPPNLNWKDVTPFSLWQYTTSAYFWPAVPLAFYAAINLGKHYLGSITSKMLGTYLFAFGYFVSSLYWVSHSLDVDMEKFGWLKPFSILGLPALLALPYAIVGLLYSRSSERNSHWVFVHSWFLVEIARSCIFPWNLLGDVSMASTYFVQFASVVGVYGMTAIVLWLSGAIAGNNPKEIIPAIIVLLAIYGFGYYRFTNKEPAQFHEVEVLLIQPNNPFHMNNESTKQTSIMRLKDLSASVPYLGKPRYIIWPEAAWPNVLQLLEMPPDSPPEARIVQWGDIARLVPDSSKLVFGYDRVAYEYNKLRNEFDQPVLHNSMAAINNSGVVLDNYDKHILVPFGEYVPLRWLLGAVMKKVAYGWYDFTPGEHSNLMDLGELRAIPLLCYEAIFSHYLKSFDIDRADFIIAITNDSWFGIGLGPYQHFAMAKMRTIEYGLPMIRAANDGITAVINPYGEVIQAAPRWRETTLFGRVPIKLMNKTIYSQLGGIILALSLLISCVIVGLSLRRK